MSLKQHIQEAKDLQAAEIKAWRAKLPKAVASIEQELDHFKKNDPSSPVTAQDEIMLWRRSNPDFKFDAAKGAIVRK